MSTTFLDIAEALSARWQYWRFDIIQDLRRGEISASI